MKTLPPTTARQNLTTIEALPRPYSFRRSLLPRQLNRLVKACPIAPLHRKQER